jgi:hypothetical protein
MWAGVLEGAAVRKLETNKFDAVYKFDWNKPIVFQVSASGSVLSLTMSHSLN